MSILLKPLVGFFMVMAIVIFFNLSTLLGEHGSIALSEIFFF